MKRRCRGCGERCDTSGRPLAVHPDCPLHGVPATVLAMLDEATARLLRESVEDIEAAIAERDRLVIEAHEAGASLREIAEHVGMTHVGVLKIIQRNT